MQQPRFGFCEYFGFLFLSYCVIPPRDNVIQKRVSDVFEVEYQWSYVNFTWPSPEIYQHALYTRRYIPEHNAIAGIKFYKDKLYFALPRVRPGTPVTLAYISTQSKSRKNLLLSPYPSWEMNVQNSCATLQNVQSMEIDRRGIMWVLDGTRINSFTSCPPKLVLLDLNYGGRVVSTYVFRNEICLHEGGFLNDLVIDESDGGYAYITDNGNIDPGLIVYSRQQGRVWKLRDRSMFPELEATNFTVDGVRVLSMAPIDGIALSPVPQSRNEERLIYYTALNGLSLYAINNKILKNEGFCKSDQWRKYIKYVGRKSSPSDGLIIDNQGNMFYGLLSTYGIGKWNIYEQFTTAKDIVVNQKEFSWPDSFAMDSSGHLYVLANGIHKFFDLSNQLTFSHHVKFRILKLYTGNKNYFYTGN